MIVKLIRNILLIICITLVFERTVMSQSASVNEDDNTSWSLYFLTSIQVEPTRGVPKDRWSMLGFGGEFSRRFNSGMGINGRMNFRMWERFGFDKSAIPFHLGPSYEFGGESGISISVYGGVGPALIWGNDYMGIFASWDAGAAVYVPAWGNNEIFFSVGIAEGMSFNSGFNYLDLRLGLRL